MRLLPRVARWSWPRESHSALPGARRAWFPGHRLAISADPEQITHESIDRRVRFGKEIFWDFDFACEDEAVEQSTQFGSSTVGVRHAHGIYPRMIIEASWVRQPSSFDGPSRARNVSFGHAEVDELMGRVDDR